MKPVTLSEGQIQQHTQGAHKDVRKAEKHMLVLLSHGDWGLVQHSLSSPDCYPQLATHPSSPLFHKVRLTAKAKEKVDCLVALGICIAFCIMSSFLLSPSLLHILFDFQK